METATGKLGFEKIEAFFASHSQIKFIDVATPDLNGIWRGKRHPARNLEKILNGGIRFPLTAITADLWGDENHGTGLAAAGDVDGVCRAIDLTPLYDPDTPNRALLQVCLFQQDGSAFLGDARQVLTRALNRLHARNLEPVAATELEFYLLKPESLVDGKPLPINSVVSETRYQHDDPDMYSLDNLDAVNGFLSDVYTACEAADVPAETSLAEYGPFQFEINLIHREDALAAADDALRLKWIVKRVARRHGYLASFLPKLWPGKSGCGQHVHVSLVDQSSKENVFNDGTKKGTPELRQAIAGLLDIMPESTLLFAPSRAAYRRLGEPAYLAPNTVTWGYDSRMPSIRVPGGPNEARRLEHRVAGGDANTYLVLASILAGIDHGLSLEKEPAPPVSNEKSLSADDLPSIPKDWGRAIDLFEGSAVLNVALGKDFTKYFTALKRKEKHRFDMHLDEFEFKSSVERL